jgi:hypothetical protein
MNENRLKVKLGTLKQTYTELGTFQSYYVKPSGKFWKRYFNKKVRKGAEHKKTNWWHWS